MVKKTKQPIHPLFRPDPEGGGIVITPKNGKESHPIFGGIESDDKTPGFVTKPASLSAGRTFLDSLPDERNVYVYDEEEGAIKPQTISRNTGRQMFGNTWGRQQQPAPPSAPQKSKLQLLKETWGKREGFKFKFWTKSKADNVEQSDSVSKITGRHIKQANSSDIQIGNSAPLFVKSLWNTHFKKDDIQDDYQIESENRISKTWEKDEAGTSRNPNFVLTAGQSERKDYNVSSDEVGDEEVIESDAEDENEGKVYNIPSSSEDEVEHAQVSVPNPNITFEKKVIERKNYSVDTDDDDDDDIEVKTEEPSYDEKLSHAPESNFSFKKKIVERKNYNVSSGDEEEGDDDTKSKKIQAPGVPINMEPGHSQRRMSYDHSDASDEMYTTYSYETGFDPAHLAKIPDEGTAVNPLNIVPNIKLQLDTSGGPGESDDFDPERKWAKPYDPNADSPADDKKKHTYENFAYLTDMADNEHNVTEI